MSNRTGQPDDAYLKYLSDLTREEKNKLLKKIDKKARSEHAHCPYRIQPDSYDSIDGFSIQPDAGSRLPSVRLGFNK